MSLNITNTIGVMWKVEDPVYAYQGYYEYTKAEYDALDWSAVTAQQEQEYNDWRERVAQLEGQQ